MPPTHHELVMELFATGSCFSVILPDDTSRLFAAHPSHWCVLTVSFTFSGRMLSVDCYTQLRWEPWSSRHPTSLVLGCDVGWRNSNSQGKRATRITRALSLILVKLSCPSALDFAWDQSNFCEFSFPYFDCLFSSASLALVSALSAMAPGQDHNSTSPATLLPARHPPQATSLFLVTVVPSELGLSTQHLQV